MKKLNWKGFLICWGLCMLAALANENVNSLIEWAIVGPGIGGILSLFPLIVGQKD